jgi:hypothetical protein
MKTAAAPIDRKNLRSVPVLLVGLALELGLWVLALYPLTPTTSTGWCAVLLAGFVVFLWVWGCLEMLLWLDRPRLYRAYYKALGYPVAVSLGVGVFAAAYIARDFIAHNFSYFFG